MIKLTKLTAKSKANKHFSENEGGVHIRRGAKIKSGVASTLEINNLSELHDSIKNLRNTECLTLGVFPETECRIVLSADEDKSAGMYGRNKQNVIYPKGKYLQLLDIDEVREGLEFRTANSVYEHLCDIDTSFEMLELLILPSSSCGVRYKGELIKGYSWHVYMVVDAGVDVADLKDWVVSASFKNGDGRVKFTESGNYSATSLFDEAVFSPERIIYAAKSTMDESFSVDELDTFYQEGCEVDEFLIETFSVVDVKDKLLSSDWVLGEHERIKAKYVEKKIGQGVKRGLTRAQSEAAATKQIDNILTLNSTLELWDGKEITIKEMCDDVEKYDKRALPDPIEGLSYGSTTAMFYWNDGKPKIHSFAHGVETVYHIEDDEGDIVAFFDDIGPGAPAKEQVTHEKVTAAILEAEAGSVGSVKDLQALLRKAVKLELSELELKPISVAAIGAMSNVGQAITVSEIKSEYKLLRKEVKAPRAKGRDGSYVDDYVFLTADAIYHECATGAEMGARAWNTKFNRETPLVDGEKIQAEVFAQDKIRIVHNTMYVPMFGSFFDYNGVDYFNTYKPVNHSKQIGDSNIVQRMLDHTAVLLPNQKDQEVLLSFIAHQVQNTGKLLFWATVLQGDEGVGKSFYADMLTAMLGGNNVGRVSTTVFNSDYNGFSTGVAVNCIDELRIDNGVDRYKGANKIKPLITDTVLAVNEKYKSMSTVLNTCNYFATTNFKDAVPITEKDRRWAVLFADNKVLSLAKKDPMYFPKLFDDMRENASELYYFFESYVIPEWITSVKRAPDTTDKMKMIDASKPVANQVVEWALEEFEGIHLENNGINVTLMQELSACDSMYEADFPKTSHLAKILMEMGYTEKVRKKIKGKLSTCYFM